MIATYIYYRYGERKRNRYEYRFQGNSICRQAFSTIYDSGEFVLKSIIKHVNDNGNVRRLHGNAGKRVKHALTFTDVQNVVKYIQAYSTEHGLPMPAAPRGRDDTAPVFLPASTTRKNVHMEYSQCCEEAEQRAVMYQTFTMLWRQCCSYIKVYILVTLTQLHV